MSLLRSEREAHTRNNLTILRRKYLVIALAACLFSAGCSLKRYAINKVGDALSSGPSIYETDEDIELVGSALPFGLKFIETLLAESPKHRGLLLTASRGFVLYSFAYVDWEAEVAEDEDLDRARALRVRARRLYLRAFRYGLRGLEVSYAELGARLVSDPSAAVSVVDNKKRKRQDVPLLYWTAASLGLAIAVARNDAAMLVRLPEVEALLDRAIELDPSWDDGTLHEFAIQLESTKSGATDYDAMRRHYDRALQLSGGKSASLHLGYAEAVSVPKQNRAEFTSLVKKTLAVDPDEFPERRLVNLLAHRRARRLLDRIDNLILDDEPLAATGETP